MDEYSKITKPDKEDYLYTAMKAGYSSLPLIGSALGELMQFVLVPPVEKRKETFFNWVAESIKRLEESGKINYAELKENEQFLDTVYTIATLVQKNSEEEKLSAFKNAILNTAIGAVPAKAITQMFLSFLDRYTIWHLKVLNVFCDPLSWADKVFEDPTETISAVQLIYKTYPELRGQEDFVNVVFNDLIAAGLTNTSPPLKNTGILYKTSSFPPLTRNPKPVASDFGKRFIEYISTI